MVTVPGNRKRKLSLGRSRADEKEMDSGDIPDIQEAEEAPSAQGKVAGQAGTPAVVGVETRSKAALAATTPAKTGQGPPPRSEQDREVTLAPATNST